MLEIETIVWFAIGVVAGGLHGFMLRRSTHRLTAWTPLLGMLRLGLVATTLIVAAFTGEILTAASGWAIGFVGSNASFAIGRGRSDIPSSNGRPSKERN